jgi:sec-independent protein translocase protein TatA
MGFIGVQELVVILLIVLVLFGAKKIPELARGLGIGLKEFRKATKELENDNTKPASELSAKESSSLSDANNDK